jgi:phenylacetyl-CoA:acceptor oxidoreductase 27-kDa subunit
MTRWGMVVDLSRCVGCQTCTIVCKLDNGTPPNIYWRLVRDVEVGRYPNVKRFFLPLQCMHCAEPPCLICPTTATQKRKDGIDYSKCIGCGYCILACPYDARWLIKGTTIL